MHLLGLDPGLATTGFAVLKVDGEEKHVLKVGVIQTPAGLPDPERLLEIAQDLQSIIDEHKPKAACIEQIFFSRNVSTAIPVAQARGVLLVTLQKNGVAIHEMAPNAMKLALTGDGHADKKAIQKMLCLELDLPEPPQPDDAADALSLALALSFQLR